MSPEGVGTCKLNQTKNEIREGGGKERDEKGKEKGKQNEIITSLQSPALLLQHQKVTIQAFLVLPPPTQPEAHQIWRNQFYHLSPV